MQIFLCLAAFVLLAKRAHSEEAHTNLEFVFFMWQNPTEFDAVATPFTQNREIKIHVYGIRQTANVS